ncbi:MAG: DUF1845 domain-containing protein, partial [Gammaproteobacteria bacterium]|nr:DUF1845 domain-containing protein [Gammaproteobacteria bacterium]
QYDEIVLLCKELEYHDVITHDECYRIIEEAGSKVRALLSLGSKYTYTPQCSRAHLASRNAIALKAIETLVGTGFINMDDYNDIDDVCSTFAVHGIAPHRLSSSSDASTPAVDPGAGSDDPSGPSAVPAEDAKSGSEPGHGAAAAKDRGEAPAGKSPESPKSAESGPAGDASAPETGKDSAPADGDGKVQA